MRPRVLKPPFVRPQIDWSHPLAKELVDYYLLNEKTGSPVNLVNGKDALTLQANAPWGVGPRGPQLEFNGASQFAFRDASSLGAVSQGTIFCGHVLKSLAADARIIAHRNSSNVSDFVAIGTGTAGSEGKLRPFWRDVNGTTRAWLSAATPGLNAPTVSAFAFRTSNNNNNYRLSINGRFDSVMDPFSPQSPVDPVLDRFAFGAAYRALPTVSFFPGSVFVGGSYIRALSDQEAEWLTAEPYALLREERRRRYYFVGTGHVLAIDSLAHAQALDAAALVQTHLVAGADLTHVDALDVAAVSQTHVVAIVDVSHLHALDGGSVAQTHIVVTGDLAHSHGLDNATVSVVHGMTADDLVHLHALGGATVVQTHIVAGGDLVHLSALDAASVGQTHLLSILDLGHLHLLDTASIVSHGPLVGVRMDLTDALVTFAQADDDVLVDADIADAALVLGDASDVLLYS